MIHMRACVFPFAVAAIISLAASPAVAQTTAAADDPRASQFDFWVGEWELTSGGKPAGTNTITREYGGAVIMERFVGSADIGLEGMSVSVFNRRTEMWHQTWVDNQSGYLDFTGGFKDGKMILSRRATIEGKEAIQRMVWSDITPDSFNWSWERSDDGGATWQVLWPIHYERKKK